MIKPTTKQSFLLKLILGVIIGNGAGGLLAIRTDPASLGTWNTAFIYTFFPLVCIVIIEWLLLSNYLPKWWVVTGFIGCIISASAVGVIHFFTPMEMYSLYPQEMNAFNYFLMGVSVALPQWFILNHKKGYLWVLANGIGWLFSIIYGDVIFYPQAQAIFSLAFVRTLILETRTLPLGLLVGLYLYTYVYDSNNLQVGQR